MSALLPPLTGAGIAFPLWVRAVPLFSMPPFPSPATPVPFSPPSCPSSFLSPHIRGLSCHPDGSPECSGKPLGAMLALRNAPGKHVEDQFNSTSSRGVEAHRLCLLHCLLLDSVSGHCERGSLGQWPSQRASPWGVGLVLLLWTTLWHLSV